MPFAFWKNIPVHRHIVTVHSNIFPGTGKMPVAPEFGAASLPAIQKWYPKLLNKIIHKKLRQISLAAILSPIGRAHFFHPKYQIFYPTRTTIY